MVKVSAKIKKNTFCGRPLVLVRAKIEKDDICGRPLVRVRAKIEKTHFVVGLWLRVKGQK